MANKAMIATLIFMVLAYSDLSVGEIENGKKTGSIVLRSSDRQIVYEGVTGERNGFYRRLISINGSPALWVGSRYKYYYTLAIEQGGIIIDCAYSNARNINNGASVSAGKCGLNMPLRENYDEIAQIYSDEWEESIFSFDTSPVFEMGQATSFLLGQIGDVKIYDRYSSAEALENASPQKYIKGHSGCFDFGKAVGFLVFLNKGSPSLQYLDVLRSEEPMKIQRMSEQDLEKVAVEKCI